MDNHPRLHPLAQIQRGLPPETLNTIVPFVAEYVKARAALLHVNQLDQLLLQMDKLLFVDGTLKDGVVNEVLA